MGLMRLLLVAALVAISALLVIHFTSRGEVHAQEQGSEEQEGPPVDEAGVEAEPAEPIHPFQRYQADDGALSYQDLSESDKARSDKIQEWAEADSGYQVHQEWAAGTAWAREHARLVIAERTAGLEGSGEVGVE